MHEKMMSAVKSALEDADVALLLMDARDNLDECLELFGSLKLKGTSILVINKMDNLEAAAIEELRTKALAWGKAKSVIFISAIQKKNIDLLKKEIVQLLPESEPFYPEDTLTDRSTRFFVAEMIREQIFHLFEDEIPYHTAVAVTLFQEKASLTKISADIVVTRETQKASSSAKEAAPFARSVHAPGSK